MNPGDADISITRLASIRDEINPRDQNENSLET
jgi:hypothetical protein